MYQRGLLSQKVSIKTLINFSKEWAQCPEWCTDEIKYWGVILCSKEWVVVPWTEDKNCNVYIWRKNQTLKINLETWKVRAMEGIPLVEDHPCNKTLKDEMSFPLLLDGGYKNLSTCTCYNRYPFKYHRGTRFCDKSRKVTFPLYMFGPIATMMTHFENKASKGEELEEALNHKSKRKA